MTGTELQRVRDGLKKCAKAARDAAMPYGEMKITAPPAVFELGGDDYCVMWATSKKGSGCVKYVRDGVEKTVYDTACGAMRTHDTVHRVFIPKTELRGSEYRVLSQHVAYKFAYSAIKGKTVESGVYRFAEEPRGDRLRMICISDVHEHEDRLNPALEHIDPDCDLVVLLGDISSRMERKSDFAGKILTLAARVSGGVRPVLYVRGNHETRGEFASRLCDYLPTGNKGLFFTFDYGPMSVAVLDAGEDKEDSHVEYSGLVDFESYRETQTRWIESLKADDFAGRYRLVFCHMPLVDSHFGRDWVTPFAKLGFSVVIGGHHHSVWLNRDKPLPLFSDGGIADDNFLVTVIELNGGKIELTTTDRDGRVALRETVDAR